MLAAVARENQVSKPAHVPGADTVTIMIAPKVVIFQLFFYQGMWNVEKK